tara:strand:- start:5139 stop:6167 length:1029 start_codon:yes stop_codon:yes gene_type:complete
MFPDKNSISEAGKTVDGYYIDSQELVPVGATPEIEKQIQQRIDDGLVMSGQYLTKDVDDIPVFGPLGDCEIVFARKVSKKGHQGSRIVLTRDNYGHRGTGFGGMGATRCEAIDIVAGSLTGEENKKNSTIQARASFINDAARIYLTERGDIQRYFGLPVENRSNCSVSSLNKSGIGIKADHTAIIGREKITIYAGFAVNADGKENLTSFSESPRPRIELSTGASKGTQPAVLGNNLEDAIIVARSEREGLLKKIQEIETSLVKLYIALGAHTHPVVALGGGVALPSPDLIGNVVQKFPEYGKKTVTNTIDLINQQIEALNSNGLTIAKGGKALTSDSVFIGD